MPAETHVERGTPMDRQQVFELIRDRRSEAAGAMMERHIRQARDTLLMLLDDPYGAIGVNSSMVGR